MRDKLHINFETVDTWIDVINSDWAAHADEWWPALRHAVNNWNYRFNMTFVFGNRDHPVFTIPVTVKQMRAEFASQPFCAVMLIARDQ